ncbi:MAG: DUF4939 domain-containing protein, partial [Cetobacterium sp.]
KHLLLQMDPQPYASSLLQETSPTEDPAAVAQLTTQVTSQAQQLAGHHQQLTRLTQLTQELAAALQGLQGAAASPNPPAPAPIPPAAVYPAPATTGPRLAFPEKFNGEPGGCRGFLMQCSLFVAQQPSLYATDDSRIAFVCSLLTGKALDWATAVWRENAFPTFEAFLARFRAVFDHSASGESAEERLLAVSQGDRTAAEYALTFRTLAAEAGWGERPL